MSDEQRSGLSRRDLIKRGAIIGGVAWSAPIVQGIASPAFAGTPGGGECEDYYRIKFNFEGGVWMPDSGTSTPDCTMPGADGTAWTSLPLGNDKVFIEVLESKDGEPTKIRVYDNPDDDHICVVTVILLKAGSDTSTGGNACTTGEDGEDTLETSTGKGISYVAGIICCE